MKKLRAKSLEDRVLHRKHSIPPLKVLKVHLLSGCDPYTATGRDWNKGLFDICPPSLTQFYTLSASNTLFSCLLDCAGIKPQPYAPMISLSLSTTRLQYAC